ncbi:uncharacterized protein LOC133931367 [Phragmites australis]|uniref:uncharacterized protein LOC133931367 n=1 Tax=Phragmites australis TaxID=29695 RepID=UPI002D78AAA6|nr:uncharacterized protein LOC133931367 [Phragmites australis]
MKILRPPPPILSGPDLSYILDRTDLSVDEKIDMVLEEHGPVVLPFDGSHFEKRWEGFKDEFMDSEDEDEDDDEDKEAEQEIGKVLGDEKEPGIVKRPSQAPLEGEPVCKCQEQHHKEKNPLSLEKHRIRNPLFIVSNIRFW